MEINYYVSQQDGDKLMFDRSLHEASFPARAYYWI